MSEPLQPPTVPYAMGKRLRTGFRTYRRMFVLVTLLCWGVAALYYTSTTPLYRSEAKILIRYVIDPEADEEGDQVSRRDQLVQSEVEVLTSGVLAQRVVDAVGASRLSEGCQGKEPLAILNGGFKVAAVNGRVIEMAFEHPDSVVAKATLQTLIKEFLNVHLETHRLAAASSREFNDSGDERARTAFATVATAAVPGDSSLANDAAKAKTSHPDSMADELAIEKLMFARSNPNLSVVQKPTESVLNDKQRNQVMAVMIAGGPVLGALVVVVLSLRRNIHVPKA